MMKNLHWTWNLEAISDHNKYRFDEGINQRQSEVAIE